MSVCDATTDKASNIVEWNPNALLRDVGSETHGQGQDQTTRFALIVLNQALDDHLDVARRLWNNASVRIAADGGANCLYQAAGQHGDKSLDDLAVIIGDLDSLTPEARAYYESSGPSSGLREGTAVIHDSDQESTDFGKAVHYIRQHYHRRDDDAAAPPLDIVALGGLGGRVDQGLSQLHHLYLFQKDPCYADGRMYLVSGESLTFLLKAGHHRIRVRDGPAGEGDVFGKYVGILPLREPSRITTKGLEWDVENWDTAFGGKLSTSNHVLPETQVVEVTTSRDVLFTIALRRA
ncbi:thiamine pyrophosphokinase [Canariomyces notabilis]|uniref:Thiamine pyrophosphokinase n=1 Tax=Canariomyces notabilis TaxID=2074819 RepID=A0AAN6YSR4_9PEZI|nr:thiamine pyrophosphokinase [Canariomyces arenarius]